MNFQVGDTVMHWNHGLGQILGLEEQEVLGERRLYYVVRLQALSLWVPADNLLASRLRQPTSASAFKRLFAILSGPADALPGDRRERKTNLHARMTTGNAESICHVIRDLTTLEEKKALNEDDKWTLKRAREMLLGEWEYSLQITALQAEDQLYQLLKQPV